MAQRSTRAAGEDGSHPAPLAAQARPSHRIDAANNGMKPSSPNAMFDRFRREPQPAKIAPRQNSMLPPSQLPSLPASRLRGLGAHDPPKFGEVRPRPLT